jgi:hypothetical protein
MKKRPRMRRPSHTTVVAYLSLFLVISGGAALAANQLHKNSVGTNQLKKNAVTTAKIKNESVTSGKIAGNAVATAKIADNAVATGKIADNAVTTGKIADNAVATGKIADNAVTTGKIADNAVTGQKVNEGSLHFTCNNPTDAVLILGGPCVFKRTTAGSTWLEAMQTCQAGIGGATLPSVAQVEAYAPLGGVPWKNVVAFTSDLAGGGPNPTGAWSVLVDENGTVKVIVATPFENKVQTDVLCVYDPTTDPTPGS